MMNALCCFLTVFSSMLQQRHSSETVFFRLPVFSDRWMKSEAAAGLVRQK